MYATYVHIFSVNIVKYHHGHRFVLYECRIYCGVKADISSSVFIKVQYTQLRKINVLSFQTLNELHTPF